MTTFAATLPTMPRKPAPESEKKVPLAARVDPSILSRVQALAESDDRTLSYMVEKLLREALDAKPPRKPAKP